MPSIFTSLSLFSGFYSITASLSGNFIHASWAIIIAALFDAADGRIARLTHSVSKFGEHYDSLVDMISFGATPAILMYLWALQPYGRWGWLATFLYVICVALRLARFNVQTAAEENKYFQGLPSPPSAVMISMTVIFLKSLGIEVVMVVMPLLTCLLALLMVSTLRYYSFKDFDFRKRRPFNVLVALVLLLIIFLAEPEILLFSGAVIYTLSGPGEYLFKLRKKKLPNDIMEESPVLLKFFIHTRMSMEKVKIFDTTLRDGEQSPGFSMNIHEKVRMAKQLEKLGVDIIEAGFPIASQGDFEAVRTIAESINDLTWPA